MSVKLRKRKLVSGKISLYLDYYNKGEREKETLKIYLIKGETTKNKEKLEIAGRIRSEREIELINDDHNIVKVNKRENFVDFFLKITKERDGKSDYNAWWSSYCHLKNFTNNNLSFYEITEEKLNEFKDYLGTVKKRNSEENLSQNTKMVYFFKVKHAVTLAFDKAYLDKNYGQKVKNFKIQEGKRDPLTLEEVQKLIKTPSTLKPVYQKAYIFSCLTGLRFSDIQPMEWTQLVERNGDLFYEFYQEKTEALEYLPISRQAARYLPDKTDSQKVWMGLVYSHANNLKLEIWLKDAGVERVEEKKGFHNARHINATLLFESGADIYTVKKLLGHAIIRSTETYTKSRDKTKIQAVNNIPDLEANDNTN